MSGKFRPARKIERLERCLNEELGEIEVSVQMRIPHNWTKRPRGALLQLGTESGVVMRSIGGRLGNPSSGEGGVAIEIPLLMILASNPGASWGTVPGG